jgi:Flp pilus assembly protein TadB
MSRQGPRSRVKQDLEILALLPDGSAKRAPLQAQIERGVAQIIGSEDASGRDPEALRWALAAIVLFVVSGSFLGFFIVVPVGLLLAAVVIWSLRRGRRDARRLTTMGQTSEPQRTSSTSPAEDEV